MDTLYKAKKLQAMNNYCYYYFHSIIFNLLIAFTFSTLFCSYPYWFPFLKKLVFDFSFSPKFFFVVFNVIVIFLIGESKLVGSNSSSPTSEIYDEYVERSRNYRGICFQEKPEQSKLEFKNLMSSEEKRVSVIQDCDQETEVVKEVIESSIQEQEEEEEEEDFKEVLAQEEFQDQELEVDDQEKVQDPEIEVKEESKDQENEEIRDGEDQESEMPAEELNRRVEEFIARVNKQRWLEESKLLVCCRA